MAYFSTPSMRALAQERETLDKFWSWYPEIDQKNIQAKIIVGRALDTTSDEYGIWLKIKGVRPPLFHRFILTVCEDVLSTIHKEMRHILSLVPSFLVKNYRQPPANWRF